MVMVCTSVLAQKPVLTVPTGHGIFVRKVVFSNNDEYVFSAALDNTIKMWSVEHEREIATYIGGSFDLSPKGEKLFTLNPLDNSLRIYNLINNRLENSINIEKKLYFDIKISNNRNLIACSSVGGITIWDLDSNRILLTEEQLGYKKINLDQFKDGYIMRLFYPISFSSDDSKVANINDDSIVVIRSLVKNKIISKLKFNTSVSDLNFIGNDTIIISSVDDTIRVINLLTNNLINYYRKSHDFGRLDQLKNNISIIQQDSFFLIFDVFKNKLLKTIPKNIKSVISCKVSNNGKMLIGADQLNKIIYVWDIETGQVIKTFSGHSNSIFNFSLVNNENVFLISGADSLIRYFNKTNNTMDYHNSHKTMINASTVSMDGNIIAFSDFEDSIFILDKSSKAIKSTSASFGTDLIFANVSQSNLILSTDNKNLIVTSMRANKSKFINCDNMQTYHQINASKCFLSKTGKLIATALDSNINIYDYKTFKKIFHFYVANRNDFCPIAISNNDSIIVYSHIDSNGSIIEINNIFNKKERSSYYEDQSMVSSIIFSNNDEYVATGNYQSRINIYSITKNKHLNTLIGHTGSITSIAFSSDSKYLFSSSIDATIKIWEVSSGRELVTIIPLDSTDWAVVAPDGRFDASPNGMKLLYYVQGLEVLPLESFFEKYYTPGLLKQVLENPDLRTDQRGPVDFRKTLRLPPKVAISSNITEMSTDQTQAKIFLQISDAGGGIDEVRLYQNGKLLPKELILDKKTTQIGRKQEITYSVPLVAGKNEFKATGFNIDRTESIPVNLVINRNAVESSINLYLMCIGINAYKNSVYNLTYAKPDAQSFVQKVEQYSSDLFKKINKYEFYDNMATRTNIEDAVNKIIAEAKPEDVFVFYYAGHGVMSEEEDGLPAEFYLIPHDVVKMYGRNDLLSTKGLSASWLKDNCAKIKAQKQLLLLDACHSGGAVESFAMMRDAATEKAILQLARSAGITVLAASGTEQSAGEYAQLGHGVFTFSLLEGMDGAADGKKDGKITVKELEAYLNDRVPALTLQYRGVEQYPTGFSRGHDFPIGMVKK